MRQFDDAEIESKIKDIEDNFNSLTAKIHEFQTEQIRLQGEYRALQALMAEKTVDTTGEIVPIQ
jgi:peptidoglycan hydrolase CwlO-like protein